MHIHTVGARPLATYIEREHADAHQLSTRDPSVRGSSLITQWLYMKDEAVAVFHVALSESVNNLCPQQKKRNLRYETELVDEH